MSFSDAALAATIAAWVSTASDHTRRSAGPSTAGASARPSMPLGRADHWDSCLGMSPSAVRSTPTRRAQVAALLLLLLLLPPPLLLLIPPPPLLPPPLLLPLLRGSTQYDEDTRACAIAPQ